MMFWRTEATARRGGIRTKPGVRWALSTPAAATPVPKTLPLRFPAQKHRETRQKPSENHTPGRLRRRTAKKIIRVENRTKPWCSLYSRPLE